MERTLKVKAFSENQSHPTNKTKQSKINKTYFLKMYCLLNIFLNLHEIAIYIKNSVNN